MNHKTRYAAPALLALLAGCGGGDLQGGSSGSGPVTLQSSADALRELGNAVAAAKLAQTPLPGSSCSSGTDSITGPATKTRSFVYFPGVSDSVAYESENYSGCVDNGVTYDGLLEAGSSADSSYSYSVRGSATGVLLMRSTINSITNTISVAQSQVGTIETHLSGNQTEIRSGLQSRSSQTPQGASNPDYNGILSIGLDGPTYDVITTSSSDGSSGFGSESIAGGYSYSSSLCSGGEATVATSAILQLQTATDGSGTQYPASGTLTITSGNSSVSYGFNASGATLSGSVSGTLSAAQVQQAFGSGSGC